MLSARFIPSLLLILAIACPSIALAGAIPGSLGKGASNEQEDRKLNEMYCRYEQALPRLVQPSEHSTLASWENKFKKALASQKGSSSLRLRAMEALGATQSALGKKDDALKTYQEMEDYAKQVGNLECQIAAGDRQLDLLASKPLESVTQTVGRLEESAEAFVNQRNNAAARTRYSDILYRISVLLRTRALARDPVGDSTKLLQHARSTLEKSVALADYGTTPLATRMYWLARTLSQLGFRAEAAAIYDKIAGMQRTGFSRLWMEYLRICETTSRDSPEYRAAIEQALAASRERGGTDEYELALRRQLGQSYRIAKEYAKSTEILTAIVGKGDDPDAQAHDMLLIAQNARDSKDVGTANRLLEEAVAKYPKTGAGQTAKAELQQPLYRQHVLGLDREHKTTWRGLFLGTNLAAIVVLVAIFARRQIKKRTRCAS